MRISKVEKVLCGVAVVLALVACKKGGDSGTEEKKEGATAAASGDKIGVPECDEFMDKYEKCIKEKVPDAAKASMEQSMKQMRDGYKQSAATGDAAKAALASGCKQSLETTKQAMGSYGCTW